MIDPDYLAKKRQELGLERYDALQKVQNWLDERYPGQARALSLNRGVLKLTTASASVATDLRFQQINIIESFCPDGVEKIQVLIRSTR